MVGVDGSASSTMAVRWATREATMRNVRLTIVHVSSKLAIWPPIVLPAQLHRPMQRTKTRLLPRRSRSPKIVCRTATDPRSTASWPIVLQPSWLAVLVGIEGSQASELATASAFDEASFRGVELVTLHAWSGADSSIPPFLELRLAMEKTLAEALTDFQERYPDVSLCRRVVFDRSCPSRGVKESGRRFPRRPASLMEGAHVRVEEGIACAAVAGRN
ncbi:hypothetical protein BMW24_015635 [Mycobacterium heckeshornense]|nr:hypothetical protein BMW24_015635 [Mycobacterium heckeshornense]